MGLFGNDKQPKAKPTFEIEYMPLTDRYYPKINGKYIDKNVCGVWQFERFGITFAEYARSEERAKEMLAEANEHIFKKGVVTKKVIIVEEDDV